MKLIDNIGLPGVCDFVQAKLERYDLSRLEWFKFLPLDGKHHFHGMCSYPKRTAKRARTFIHEYRIRCSVNIKAEMWPKTVEEAIGTQTEGHRWYYLFKTVTYATVEEAAVFLAGHEAYHFLRHSRQIAGRNTEPASNVFGLEWLDDYRAC